MSAKCLTCGHPQKNHNHGEGLCLSLACRRDRVVCRVGFAAGDDVEFAKVNPQSTVHVVGEPNERAALRDKALNFVYGYVGTTLCGLDIYLYREGGMVGEDAGELCPSCRGLLPALDLGSNPHQEGASK